MVNLTCWVKMFIMISRFFKLSIIYVYTTDHGISLCYMVRCAIHKDYFDDQCTECRNEYKEMKGISDKPTGKNNSSNPGPVAQKRYKEFTEIRAKKLYEELMIQYLKNYTEVESAEKARNIIKEQCRIRGIPYWSWI